MLSNIDKILIAMVCIGACSLIVLRVYGRIRYPYAMAGDVFFHLICAEAIRANSFRLPKQIPGFMIKTGYTYPPLYHYILAIFKEKLRFWFERYSSVIFDIMQTVVVLFTVRKLFISLGDNQNIAFYKSLAVASANLLSPVFNAHIWGARVMTGTARTLGEMLFVMAICFSLLWEIGAGYYFAVLAMIMFGLLSLSSKFGLQVCLSLLIVLLFFLKFSWIALIVGGLFFSYIISFGHILKVIKGHINHSKFYFEFLQHHYYGLKKGQGQFFGLTTYLARFISSLSKRFYKFIYWLLNEKSFYHVILFYNFQILIFFAVLFLQPQQLNFIFTSRIGNSLLILVLSSSLPVIFTTFRLFRCFGENYRYLEYYQWIYWFLLSVIAFKVFLFSAIFGLILSLCLINIAINLYKSWHMEYLKSAPFFDEIKKLYSGKFGFALGGKYYEFIYRGKVNVLIWTANMVPGFVPYKDLEELFYYYPYPKPGNSYLGVLKKYSIDIIMCHEQVRTFLGPEYFRGLAELKMPVCQLQLFHIRNTDRHK